MHLGLNNVKAKYEMNGKDLEEVIEEREFGVIIQSDLLIIPSDLKCRNNV